MRICISSHCYANQTAACRVALFILVNVWVGEGKWLFKTHVKTFSFKLSSSARRNLDFPGTKWNKAYSRNMSGISTFKQNSLKPLLAIWIEKWEFSYPMGRLNSLHSWTQNSRPPHWACCKAVIPRLLLGLATTSELLIGCSSQPWLPGYGSHLGSDSSVYDFSHSI